MNPEKKKQRAKDKQRQQNLNKSKKQQQESEPPKDLQQEPEPLEYLQQKLKNEEQQKLDAEKLQQELQNKLNEIRKIVATGDYIFRGENKKYSKISSKLRRHFQTIMGRAVLQENGTALDFNPIKKILEDQLGDSVKGIDFAVIEKSLKENVLNQIAQNDNDSLLVEDIQREFILKEVKEYVDFENEIDVLVELQHYGGITNLIDFSHDLAVALFFACNGEPEKPGRLILLNKKAKGIVSPKKNQNNRIVFQKSVFVQRDDGCIDEQEEEVEQIVIPQNLKTSLLTYVENYFNIKTETIYGDLMGYIKNQERHDEAYKEFFSGTIYDNKNFEKPINCYTRAINLQPNFPQAYNNRGIVYKDIGDYDNAIIDFTKTIELNPNYAEVYNNRGNVYDNKYEYDLAIIDYTKVIELNPNMAEAYNNRGVSYRNKRDYDLAIADYTKAIKLNPNYIEAHYNYGIAKTMKRGYKEAREYFEIALRLAEQYKRKEKVTKIQEAINILPADSDS